MARTTKPLTNTEVNNAKPKAKIYSLHDGGGLQLRVKPNGSKSWLFDYYRPFTKKRTTISLGNYPAISIAAARKERDKAKSLLAQKIDPKEQRDTQAREQQTALRNTLEAVAAQWLEAKRTKVTSEHADDCWRSLELHIFPQLGKLPIHKITAIHAIDTIKPIAARGSLETVKRLCQRLNEVMIYAANSGLIKHNPLSGIGKAFQSPKKQHQPTLPPDGLPRLMHAISMASVKLTTRCLIEWQLHTMVRPGEAAGTRWDEIDQEQKLWIIPAERMKKNRQHIVPLTDAAISLLNVMQPISGQREHIFPSDRNPRTHTNASTANMALKRMGFGGILVAHGLRALASTTLNEQGFDPEVIEAALAHVGNSEVRNSYNRANYLERRIPLMNWWSEHIELAATGNMSLTGTRTLKADP